MVANKTNHAMFWHIVIRALQLKFQRVMIIFIALMVGTAIVSAMSAVYFDIHTKMSQELRTFGANFYLGAKNNHLMKESEFTKILNYAPQGLIGSVSPYLYGIVRSEQEKILLMGMWFDAIPMLYPYWQVTGARIGVNFDDRHAMIGHSLAQRLNLKVGDTLTLVNSDNQKHTFTIKGIIEAGDGVDNMLIVSLDFAQEWLAKQGFITYAQMNMQDDKGQVLAFANKIQMLYPNIDAHPILKVSASEGQILEKIKALMGLIVGVILVLSSLCVNTTLMAIIGERAKEFALQKALGAKKRHIIKQILTEIGLITLGATLAGLLLGYVLAQILGLMVFHSSIDIRLPVIPLTFLLSFGVALISVILPTRRALNIQMAKVLKGE